MLPNIKQTIALLALSAPIFFSSVLAAVVAGITLNVIGSDLKIIDMKPRTETLLYSGWTFYAGDNTSVKGDATPEGGRTVTIPHVWQI